MKTFECAGVCEACPLNTIIAGGPVIAGELSYTVPAAISGSGTVASFEIHNGIPKNFVDRKSIIGIAGKVGVVKVRLEMPGELFDDGGINESFESCEGPTKQRYGLFNLRTRLACTALASLQQ